MYTTGDLIAYDDNGQISLIAEVKARTNTSRLWATQMRRNMLAHGTLPNSRFFLLALPDRLYLWANAGNLPELIEPTYEMDATPFFQPYYERSNVTPDAINGQSFELIVTLWLNEIIQSGVAQAVPETQRRILEESGLLDALRGGRVAVNLPV